MSRCHEQQQRRSRGGRASARLSALQQPEAASPSSQSSDFNNAPLPTTSPLVAPSVSPKNLTDESRKHVAVALLFLLLPPPPPKTTPSDSQHYKLGEVITSGTRSSSVQRGEFIITHLKKKSRPVVSSSRANYLQGRAVRAPLRGCEVKFTAEDREVVRKQRGQRRRRGTGEGCK